MVSAVQISNRLWPSLVASSSRMRRLVSSSSALYTSATHESICKCTLASQEADATRQHAAPASSSPSIGGVGGRRGMGHLIAQQTRTSVLDNEVSRAVDR